MLRFGIVGTNFVSEWFAQGCRESGGAAEAVAVFSRDAARGRAFADANGLVDAFDSLDALAASDTVDAIYVASPMKAHHAQALQVLAHGKHLLGEKMIAQTHAEASEIFETAARAGVVAMEGVRNVHDPMLDAVRAALPAVGPIRTARFEKLQYSSRYDRYRSGERDIPALSPTSGSSALADIGVYCLEPALALFGTPTSSAGASVHLDNGFEASGEMRLDYGNHLVTCAWSKITDGVAPSVIIGEDGAIVIDSIAECTRVTLQPRKGAPEVVFERPGTTPQNTMHYEIEAFTRQVAASATDPRFTEVSLTARRLMDAHLA